MKYTNSILPIVLSLLVIPRVASSSTDITQGQRNIINELQQLNQSVKDLNEAKEDDRKSQERIQINLDTLARKYHEKPQDKREVELFNWRKVKMSQFRQTETSLEVQAKLIEKVLESTTRIRKAMGDISNKSPEHLNVQALTNDKLRAISGQYEDFLSQNTNKLDPQLVQHYNMVVKQLKSVPTNIGSLSAGGYNLDRIEKTERQIRMYQTLLAQLRAVNKRGSHALENAILATVQSRIANQVQASLDSIKFNSANSTIDLATDSIDETGRNSAFVEIERF